uniref:Rhodanese domain-containing protein n=1 Tax=Dasya binghamiae TaxID=1896963 RepID=A0A1C8XS52_9FLOR|nr:hypothetical protein BI108_pgp150 [Dasya binghamiae]AOH77257.1 hypothetical protein [Dasya binghamiae]
MIDKINLLKDEYNLYAKHLKLTNVGINGQKRLKKSKVLIIGAGGLGCPAMLYLVASGIGYIGIVDDDYIDISNLNRQIIYNINNINTHKLITAKNNLVNLNPYCKIVLHKYKLNDYNALEIMQYYNIIIDATDNFKTRYIIDINCYKLHKLHIYGAVQEFNGQLAVFNYKNYMRYSYIYNKDIINLSYNNCDYNGILGITTGNIGILQATETIKIILGIGNIIYKQLLIYNLLNLSIKKITFYIRPQNIVKINIRKKNINSQLFVSKSDLINLTKNYIFIDIRNNYEFRKNYIEYFINIPLNKFKTKKTITFIKNKSENNIFIIYCNTTYRSLTISKILNNHNINHLIIKVN